MGGENEEADAKGGDSVSPAEEPLPPWEQHSAVIRLPRFDYRAPSELLERHHSGFLVTCPLKREKSATKEAISILEEYAGRSPSKSLDNDASAKRRRLSSNDSVTGCAEIIKDEDENNNFESCGAASPSLGTDENAGNGLALSLVKLTRSGLLLFVMPLNSAHPTVDIVSNICCALDSGNLKAPNWCHRIFPIQQTCLLIESELRMVVKKLFMEFLGSEQDNCERSIKFAVGYNRRGIDDAESAKTEKSASGSALAVMGRDKCFEVVGDAIRAVAKNCVVDLRSPVVAVLVELLPIWGVPKGSYMAGMSVVPHGLVATKPRLCIRALSSDPKPAKKGE